MIDPVNGRYCGSTGAIHYWVSHRDNGGGGKHEVSVGDRGATWEV